MCDAVRENFEFPVTKKHLLRTYRIKIPLGIRRGHYWNDQMVDLREEWQLGDRQARGSLDTIARYLGVGEKNGHGEEFARLWREDRDRAIEYLRRDVELTARIAEVLGMVELPTRQIQPAPMNADPDLPFREQVLASESYSTVN
jgi:hypothetical protein